MGQFLVGVKNESGQANIPGGLGDVVSVATGHKHSVALKNNGTIMAWGGNSEGETTVPAGLSGVIAIAASRFFSLALKNDQTVVGRGENSDGECTPPSGLSGVVSIAAGYKHALAVKSDGTVVGWGRNVEGQVTPPSGLSGIISVAGGQSHSIALRSDHTVVGWGDNSFGQSSPPSGLNTIVAISAGAYHSLALKSDGTVVAWGANALGQATVPSGLNGVVAIAAGNQHSLALKNDGTIVAWGDDSDGQTALPAAATSSTITATAQDIAGSSSSTSITVTRSQDSAGNLTDPVQLQVSTTAGFADLPVTLTPTATVPGTVLHVYYDFDGDGVNDHTANDFTPVTQTYSAGQYFPVVTVETSVGKFSSGGGWTSSDPNRLKINVQAAPVMITDQTISVTDPIDLKCTADQKLYVLSRSTATIFEYDVSGSTPTQIRSLSGIGTTPTGLDVDSAGNVYVAISGDNQVARFTPSGENSFELDSTFGNAGVIGKADKSTGSGNSEFNAPYDVSVSPDGTGIAVSDSGNNRIQQFTLSGEFTTAFGQFGSGAGQLNSTRGLSYNTSSYLYVVDSGNNRIALAGPGGQFVEPSGTAGSTPGNFQGPVNLSFGSHGIYVADTGNNRVQSFSSPASHAPLTTDSSSVRFAISSGIDQPAAAVAVNNLASELLYVADTGHNRVLFYNLTGDEPASAFASMKSRLAAADISGAVSYFSVGTREDYRRAFLSSESAVSLVGQIGSLMALSIKDDIAEYYFTDTVGGQVITFPVTFIKENGVWKILEF
jgi:hypothetical protein